ncbi:MAG: hypothetical protein NT120_00115 [Candidatus Aenigmarchaeota archaeon]|nr:hypothetical protein [Candidatus Aenigmarchaeota archaeon]
MVEDIGYLIFTQLLGMTQYPGSPFTGNLFKDLVMFFIVPTIFIIIIVFSMTGRIVVNQRLRLMLGVGAYLFIIAGGYYPAFALLAGPYFVFLIFIMGLVYFIVGHVTGGTGARPGGYREAHKFDMNEIKDYKKRARGLTGTQRISYLKNKILVTKANLDVARDKQSRDEARDLGQILSELQEELEDEESKWDLSKRRN